MDKVPFTQFKSQTLGMLNLLEDAGNKFPEGSREREAAYSEIAISLGQPDNCFCQLS